MKFKFAPVGWVVLSLLVWTGFPAAGELPTPSADVLKYRCKVLTDPELAGRGSGTPEAGAAAETLAVWMAELGLEPAFDGSWFQEFPLAGEGWTGDDLSGKSCRNVAGILPGTGRLAHRYVVVGAHYDHLGRVTPVAGSAPPPAAGEYYPGANDNASGVAIVFELIRLASAPAPDAGDRRSVIFAGFSGEEVGLQGSGFMVSHLPVDADSVDAMVNLDTIGQLNADRLYVSGVGTSPSFTDLVHAANTGDLELSLAPGGWSGSDHMSFNTREIPVLFVFGGAYPQYNRPSDDWSTLDYPAMTKVTAYTDRLLRSLRREQGDLPWLMIAKKNLRDGGDEGQNKDTWFGSLPDFTTDIKGYKLAGVFDDSPAALAGLQKGDVLVEMGGSVVEDLATFTRALRSLGPGDLVEVRVERDGRLMNFTVVMGNRSDRR